MTSLRSRRIPIRGPVALVAAGLVAYAALAPSARAQSTAQDFTAGQGLASAYVLHVGEAWNGADIGVGFGVVGGQYQDSSAKASSEIFDPGILTLLANVRTCNQPSALTLPSPLEADTDASNGQPVNKSSGATQSGPAAGSQSVRATPNADGSGEGQLFNFELPGLLAIQGGYQHAESKVDPAHQVRTVTSEVRIGSLSLFSALPAGGIQLGGLRWFLQEVVTGPDNRSDKRTVTSSFSVHSARSFGVQVPVTNPDQAKGTLDRVNTIAQPFGVQLRLPRVEPDGQFGLAYTPMTVALGGKTLFGPVIAPLLGGASITKVEQALKPGVFDSAACNELLGLLKSIPQLNATWNSVGSGYPLVLGALAAGLDGQGELDIDLGKVRTSVDDTYYAPPSYPLPNYGGVPPVGSFVPGVAGTAGTAGSLGSAAQSQVAAPALGQRPGTTAGATLAGHIHCETTSPVGWPGCWKGAAPVAAGAAGLVTLSLLAADEVFRRRRLAGADADAGAAHEASET